MIGKCNCGRDSRYTVIVDGEWIDSCNKYKVCPTYEELERELVRLETLYKKLLGAAGDLTLYREGTSQYKEADELTIRLSKEFYSKGV
jgi:hypothetical protein